MPKDGLGVDVRRQHARREQGENHCHSAPECQPGESGLPAPRGVVQDRGDGEHQQRHSDRPAGDVPPQDGPVAPAVVLGHRVGERTACHEQQEPRADGDGEDRGQDRGSAVLPQRRPVALDAVDPVAAALDLTHRSRHREQGEDQPDRQRDLTRALAGLGAGHRTGQGVAASGAGRDGVDRARQHPLGSLLVDVGGQAGEREHERHDRERTLQGEGAGVGEPVAVPEAHERVDEQAPDTGPTDDVPRVLGVELVTVHLGRDRNRAGGAHRCSLGRLLPGLAESAGRAATSCGFRGPGIELIARPRHSAFLAVSQFGFSPGGYRPAESQLVVTRDAIGWLSLMPEHRRCPGCRDPRCLAPRGPPP